MCFSPTNSGSSHSSWFMLARYAGRRLSHHSCQIHCLRKKALQSGSRKAIVTLQPASMSWRCLQVVLDPFQKQNGATAGPNYPAGSMSTGTNGHFSHLAPWFNELVI